MFLRPCLTIRPGASLPRWRRALIAILRGFYFRRVRVTGDIPPSTRPRLVLCSHRNGAIDGYIALAAFPRTQFLLSVQLLRHFLLRLMFAGIPVAREKDCKRYGIRRRAYASPIEAACAHLRAGGTLVTFPEGSSEWGPHPLPYQAGGARIVRLLLEEGVNLEVIPAGLFYTRPDGFRSAVEILVGSAVNLPGPEPEEHPRSWEKRIHAVLSEALDSVSVNCPDQVAFEQVERLARSETKAGADGQSSSYARRFLFWQDMARRRPDTLPEAASPSRAPRPVWGWPFFAAFYLFFAPVLLAALYAGRKADGRNTVTFFRMAGGLAAALLWLPVLLGLATFFPLPVALAALAASIGWFLS